MEFFQSALRNFRLVENCILQENGEFLSLLVPTLAHHYSIFQRIKNSVINVNGVSEVITAILNVFRHQLFRCDNLLLELTDTNHLEEPRVPLIRQRCRGRPRLDIPEDQVVILKRCGLSWSKIARVLHLSRQSLWNFRRQNNIHDPRAYSNLSNRELLRVIYAIKREHPSMGYKYVWATLKSRGIFITWARLISCVKFIDPIGVLSRRRRRLRRRQYRVKAANYLWHMDANEKLVNWNLYVHACVDGFSRKILYLQLATTKKAESVSNMFTEGVQNHGLPMRVRGDRGTENARVIDYMESERSNIEAPFIQGRSVHNTRIERLWGEVNPVVSSNFRSIFFDLEERNLLSEHSGLDLMCLYYVYFPRIQRSLDTFKDCWNNHGIRTACNASPNELWLISMLDLSFGKDVFALRLVPVSLDLNFASAPSDTDTLLSNVDVSIFGLSQESWDHFCDIAGTLVPDPFENDNHEGKSLYLTLRNHFSTLIG